MSRKRNLTLSGYCDYDTKSIYVPFPDTREGLHTYLHECAHVVLKHDSRTQQIALDEYEAERWAIDTLRREGVSISREMMNSARDYVRSAPDIDDAPAYVRRWVK